MSEEAYRRYVCRVCGYIYDEALGDPDGGLPPGTRFDDIPDDWECPDCGVTKADFTPLEAPDENAARPIQSGMVSNVSPGTPDQTVILGGGMAGWAAAEAIRAKSSRSKVLLVTQCTGDVYPKPQLSASAAKGRAPEDLITESGEARADELGIGLMSRTRVLGIDCGRGRVLTPRGGIPYQNLILALGAHQPQPPVSGSPESILQVNDLSSYRRLRDRVDRHQSARIVIMGGGLIGCEFADDLARAGHSVTVVDQAAGPIRRLLPEELSQRLADAMHQSGIRLDMGCTVESVAPAEDEGEVLNVALSSGEHILADVVVSALGLQPNTQIASRAGLKTAKGIVVDSELRTSDPSVFAIGDCAEHDGKLLPYVQPLREQAPVIASQIVESTGAYEASAGTVIVKTPTFPLAVWAPEVAGKWVLRQSDDGGMAFEHLTDEELTGFALSGRYVREASDYERRLSN